jgi:hypothetical protein
MLMKKVALVGLFGIALALNLAGVAEAKEPQGCESVVLTLPNGRQHKYVDCPPLIEPLPPAMVEKLKRLMEPKPVPKPEPRPNPVDLLSNPGQLPGSSLSNPGQLTGSDYLPTGVR